MAYIVMARACICFSTDSVFWFDWFVSTLFVDDSALSASLVRVSALTLAFKYGTFDGALDGAFDGTFDARLDQELHVWSWSWPRAMDMPSGDAEMEPIKKGESSVWT